MNTYQVSRQNSRATIMFLLRDYCVFIIYIYQCRNDLSCTYSQLAEKCHCSFYITLNRKKKYNREFLLLLCCFVVFSSFVCLFVFVLLLFVFSLFCYVKKYTDLQCTTPPDLFHVASAHFTEHIQIGIVYALFCFVFVFNCVSCAYFPFLITCLKVSEIFFFLF